MSFLVTEKNCSNDFPTTDQYYAEIFSDSFTTPLVVVSSLLTTVVIIIFLEEVWYLHFNYRDEEKRGRIIFLLGIYPVVCSSSFLAVLVPRSTVLDDFLSACYIAVGIYQFVQLTIQYFGGQDAMIRRLNQTKIPLRTPPVCCCCFCLPTFKLKRKSLMVLETIVLQATILRPILAFVSAVLWTDGKYDRADTTANSAYTYLNALGGISSLMAIYGLIIAYRASAKPLKHYHLRIKFVCLQIVIIVNNIQNLLFTSILAKLDIPPCIGSRGPQVRASGIHHLLLIVEMFLLSIVARYAYRHTDDKDCEEHVDLTPPVDDSTDSTSNETTVATNRTYGATDVSNSFLNKRNSEDSVSRSSEENEEKKVEHQPLLTDT